MKVNVEACWGGGPLYFRLTFTCQGRTMRERVQGEKWTREVATEALDLLENVYHVPRRTIRFVHH